MTTAGRVIVSIVVLVAGRDMLETASAQTDTYAEPPINYMTAEVHDRVAELAKRIEAGKQDLAYDEELGYLPSVLEALDVPASSQTLVYSKTSLQLHRISPRKPRAVYFNDDVYVGFCQNGDVLELAATDAKQGATFYTLSQERADRPEFVRDQGLCLSCHASHKTQDVPGYLVRSVYSDRTGRPILGSGTYVTDHTSEFVKRWGGWYVTGDSGGMPHMGNTLFDRGSATEPIVEANNRDSLEDFIDPDAYLAPTSDVVALMVMEHQTQMHNALAAGNYEARRAIAQSFQMNQLLDRPEGFLSESCQRRLDKAAERIVKYLFFSNEFPLAGAVKGSSEFQRDFVATAHYDSQGRSLRQFDLKTRLFRYPCSYLIESPAFDALPPELLKRVKRRIQLVLAGEVDEPHFAHLTPELRRKIRQILSDIKPSVLEPPSDTAVSLLQTEP